MVVKSEIEKSVVILLGGFKHPQVRCGFSLVLSVTLFLLLCGLAFVAAGLLPLQLEWSASVIILLIGVTTFVSELRSRSFLSNGLQCTVIAGVAFVVEFVGVSTAFPFGSYSYTDVLGFRLLGVPVAIAFAWYATAVNTRRIAEWIHTDVSPLRIAFVSGVLTLALDIVLEPTAAFIKGYWIWDGQSVPVQNYIGWFVLGFVAVLLVTVRERGQQTTNAKGVQWTACILFSSQFVLFAATNVAHGFILQTLIGLVFVGVVMFFRSRHAWYVAAERSGGS